MLSQALADLLTEKPSFADPRKPNNRTVIKGLHHFFHNFRKVSVLRFKFRTAPHMLEDEDYADLDDTLDDPIPEDQDDRLDALEEDDDFYRSISDL